MKLSEFDYFLPKGRIAKYPLEERDSSYRIGHMPLPPYIKRDATEMDRGRYQTVMQ